MRGLCFNVGLTKGDVCADETGRIPDVEIKEIRKIVYSIVGTEIAKKGLIFSGTRIFIPTIRANLHRQNCINLQRSQTNCKLITFPKLSPKKEEEGDHRKKRFTPYYIKIAPRPC